MLSVSVCLQVITLSGFYCIYQNKIYVHMPYYLALLSSPNWGWLHLMNVGGSISTPGPPIPIYMYQQNYTIQVLTNTKST